MTRAILRPLGHREAYEVVRLSARERSLLLLVRQGLASKEIAQKTGLTLDTIETYITDFCHALKLAGRPRLQAWADQHWESLKPQVWVEARFHENDDLPGTPSKTCPCLWCSSLRIGESQEIAATPSNLRRIS